jgi:uridine kinase
MPEPASEARSRLINRVAFDVTSLSPHRLRVAIDGLTGAGKTSFGHELAASVRALERTTLRASMDDFKRPWRHAREHGYDRVTGEGYYRNAYDFEAARDLLLDPAGDGGSGQVVLCAWDPLTGQDHREKVVSAPPDSMLIVDSVFACRPEYDRFWDYRIWLEVDPELSRLRGIRRDTDMEGVEEATRVRRERYQPAEMIYLAEVNPRSFVNLVIDNSDFRNPRVLSTRPISSTHSTDV